MNLPLPKKKGEEWLTCSSRESDAASFLASALLSSVSVKARLLLVGLSGGESSELGVVSVSALDRSSGSSLKLSKTLSVESDDIVLVAIDRISAGPVSNALCFVIRHTASCTLPEELG